ncbi:MAG: glutamine-hydrolyzing GMP synthase [Clostridiales bacterium]|nr:glutamine-hydrolyzing GMP synthase [Clostridiales bacterium]
MSNQLVLVLDFGGQYKELIARRVREMQVLSLILPGDTEPERIRALNPIGIILTGGPSSVYNPDSSQISKEVFEMGIPVLGICYGMQLIAHTLGGKVEPCKVSEYGKTDVEIISRCSIFEGLEKIGKAVMSHTDFVSEPPMGFKVVGKTESCAVAAMANESKKIFGVQFHPEVEHSDTGRQIIRNFVYNVCGAVGDYTMEGYIEAQIEEIRARVGSDTVVLGLSGGVDSSVVAAMLSKAIGKQLVCIFVDHGLMRKNEGDEVENAFKNFDLRFIRVNAEQRFLEKLKGVTDPEQKRKIIGAEFIRVFEEEAKKLGDVKFLAQGTIYPDVIESGAKNSANIKSHHNVGGLPKDMMFKELVEPLRGLFKDEVRAIGRKLGLPERIVSRQPFPGPGLAVRVIGEITKEKLDLLREADAIFCEEVEKAGVAAQQYFAVLTNLRSVGVMGDSRTYDYTVALRAVNTTDFMTCEYCKIPHEVLDRAARRISGEVKGVSRVVYDISGKPPATIEWE